MFKFTPENFVFSCGMRFGYERRNTVEQSGMSWRAPSDIMASSTEPERKTSLPRNVSRLFINWLLVFVYSSLFGTFLGHLRVHFVKYSSVIWMKFSRILLPCIVAFEVYAITKRLGTFIASMSYTSGAFTFTSCKHTSRKQLLNGKWSSPRETYANCSTGGNSNVHPFFIFMSLGSVFFSAFFYGCSNHCSGVARIWRFLYWRWWRTKENAFSFGTNFGPYKCFRTT